ncbi:methyl-accepting chemotaxis protein [Oceanirhabdus seepicola]|uniref:Methyl-accepting chemotaxis protein n=1 Tax=Oceanirhabdus seepicola TaxID=2828781 RepID=A0A9J6NYF2_9CLOT|nr:methyl-accepting chemotaxis protein [Oceanirhabdus seepicola]MCM1989474.1 methyl-accepting chemotaxis protein [Oceanirhabdus seepicola]
MKMSLKAKLISMIFIFISVPLITLGIVSYNMASNAMKESTEQELRDLTTQTAEAIEQTIDSVRSYVQIISHNEDLARVAAGDKNSNSEVFKLLSKIQKENSNKIEMLFITDAFGKGIISSRDKMYSEDLSDREYIKNALKGSLAESEVIISKSSKEHIITIAYPLVLENKVVGTIVASIRFENITHHASKVKVGESGYAYMIDRDGQFVYHPESGKILKENIGNTDNTELKALVEKMKSGETDEGYYTYEGVHKYVRFTPANNWIVVVTANYEEYMSAAIEIRKDTIIITILALIIAMLNVYIMTSKTIINPIKKLEKLMTKAGDGDLTVEAKITTKDEIQRLGESFNQMIEHQSNIIRNVRMGSEEVSAASEEVSASTEEISSSSEQIAKNIQEVALNSELQNNSIVETSEVLLQLSSLVQIAQSKAHTAKDNSQNTMSVAQTGRTKVKETVEAIGNINKVSAETEAILSVLDDLSKRVSGIISTINNISDQTNLLALNAAIEAARAGEHGKGFTVVADEVRKLSVETSAGANEISSLVNEMVMHIEKAVESMNFGKQAVENGVIVANETDESFITIINAVDQIAKDIEQIADVTKDEVASSDKIVKLIDTVATTTETTLANSEEVAAAAEEQSSVIENLAASSEETSAMAVDLNNLVEKFII